MRPRFPRIARPSPTNSIGPEHFQLQFTCSLCTLSRSIARHNLRTRISHLQSLRQRRNASSITPATTINAPSEVPLEKRELYNALERVKTHAGNFVGLSRLGLALRSLEAPGPGGVVRVAILAARGNEGAAMRLARLLLADPLGKVENWEADLSDPKSAEGASGKALVIKYGDETIKPPSNPLLWTLPVPSRVLKKYNIEILISSLHLGAVPTGEQNRVQNAILVPTLETPTSTSGRYMNVTHPVHKTLLLGEGLKSLIEYGQFTAGQELSKDLCKLAISLPNSAFYTKPGEISPVDLEIGEKSLEKIRESIENATIWEEGWFRAGIPNLSAWLLESSATEKDTALKPAITNLIESILEDTEKQIDSSESEATKSASTATVSQTVRAEITKVIEQWSEASHGELRDKLDMAFASKHWRRLKWYKLFWRSDDVAIITSDILERRWLVEAEKGAIFLAGRIEGAGLLTNEQLQINSFKTLPLAPQVEAEEKDQFELRLSDLVKPDVHAADDGALLPPAIQTPWPKTIPLTRHAFATRTIPSLEALAQKLVLQTTSTTAISAGISAFAYTSTASTSLFEAGAVFAFGTVLGLWRMQGKWQDAVKFWEGEVREEGRKAVRGTEEGVTVCVIEGGRGVIDEVGIEDRKVAREAVDHAKRALDALR
ncbi:Methionine aminopeptidase 1 [Venturia nashicola]|uniref:Methionine aminopeptidase 1 n=1 Tax=Venturia nashicola TaxID=86259 RepID=A0A4Z1NSA9_9PEZI|nr:Methionine aminopeptidase 1 [Venturia nashicola]TLD18776.1 Methionine aminopeptidase 1 [Venturia nashicola]